MRKLYHALLLTLFGLNGLVSGVYADERLQVTASFSILGDLVAQVGGERIDLHVLVGADSDAHVYQARPVDIRLLRQSDVLIVNGQGFEGWLERLQQASDYSGQTIIVTEGMPLLDGTELSHEEDHEEDSHVHRGEEHHDDEAHHDEAHHDEEHHDDEQHEDDARGHLHDDALPDPHFWHDIARVSQAVDTIARGLALADPQGADYYASRAAAYQLQLSALNQELKQLVAQVPEAQRKIITTHDAFNYLAVAFGFEIYAAQGISTESEPSARDVALLIRQIREHNVQAVFAENISDDRLIMQISRETGAQVGGTLYSGALSSPDGPAADYIAMMRHNLRTLTQALQAN